MAKSIYASIILFFCCCTCFAQVVNTNLSNSVTFDGEPYIAINPTNPQNIVAAWMGLRFSSGAFRISIITRASFNGGNTWNTAVTLPHHQTTFGSADVSMAFDKGGLLYISFIDYNEAGGTGGDYIARSYNGGQTWDTATEVTDISEVPSKAPLDRPWLVVDNSSTANSGTLYITSKPAPWISPPNRNYYKVSTDSGHTWSAIANVDGGNYLVGNLIAAPMAAPTTTINGHFCAVYPSYVASQNILPAFYLATSKDKGQSFSYSTVITYNPSPLDTNLKGGYRLAASPVDSNKMVMLATESSTGDADIMALHSNDGGQTWSAPVRVNDDSVGNGKAQDMVWAAYNEQGKLAVTWRDRRNQSTIGFWNAGYDFYYATSNDNGQTFSTNKLLSSQLIAFDSIIAQNGNDFMSSAFHDDTLYSVWGDTRSGKMNIYFAKTIASIDSTVSVIQLEGDEPQWSIYPNPITSVLNVNVAAPIIGKEVSVYDANGRKISDFKASSAHFEIPTTTWAPGSYFVRVGEAIKKIVKQ